jgi:hypothetical protein
MIIDPRHKKLIDAYRILHTELALVLKELAFSFSDGADENVEELNGTIRAIETEIKKVENTLSDSGITIENFRL